MYATRYRTVLRWLRPPMMESAEAGLQARQLFYLLVFGLVVAPLFALLLALMGNEDRQVLIFVCLAVTAGLAVLYGLLQARKLTSALGGLVGLGYLAVTIVVFAGGGLADPSIAVYYVLLLLTAAYLGRRATLLVSSLIAATLSLAYWMESIGHLQPWVSASAFLQYLVLMLALAIQTLLLILTVNQLARRAHRITEQADSLQMQNVRLAETQISLQRHSAQLQKANRILQMEIEHRQAAEAALRQAQKLESLGLLAGGVAHDFNNLLTGIITQAELALLKLDEQHPARRNIERSIQSAQNAADLTRQLLTYAGRGKVEPEDVNLNQVIAQNRDLFESSVKGTVKLDYRLAPELPPVHMDRAQLQQVLMNLVLNAIDAVHAHQTGGAGEVRITTGTTKVEAPFSDDYVCTPTQTGPHLFLEVIDNGHGIDAQTLTRIFDPFYSTKVTGHGLGLSAVLGIVRSIGGGVRVESCPGEGSRFYVCLPIAERIAVDRQMTATDDSVLLDAIRRADRLIERTILIIDDDNAVRATAADILSLAGARTLVATSGAEGIELYRIHAGEIDAVLLDMRMPGMDGATTLQRLHALAPELPVLLASGYVERTSVASLIQPGRVAFLPKPYSVEQLIAALYGITYPA